MHYPAEPAILVPASPHPDNEIVSRTFNRVIRQEPRYVPERGLVRRLRAEQAHDGLGELAARHRLDAQTRTALAAEFVKSGAPPITPLVAEKAISRLVSFEPLNADALRPFIVLSTDRALRAVATARIGETMRKAGRSVRLISDAIDTNEHPELFQAGQKLGCGITRYEGSPNCVEILQRTDLACLAVIEAGFRAPLDNVSLMRLNALVQATGAEPIMAMRPEDVQSARMLSKIGLKRIVLVRTEERISLGPIFSALRHNNLVVSEILDMRQSEKVFIPANAKEMAELLM